MIISEENKYKMSNFSTNKSKNNNIPQIIFDVFLRVYLIGSMCFFIPGQLAYIPQELVIQYSAFIFFALSLFVPPRRQISNIYLSLFFLYSFINTFLFSFTDFSRMTLLNIFLGILTIKILAERIDFNFKKIGWTFIGFVLANLFLLYLQVLNRDPIFTNLFVQNMPQVDQVGFMGARFALGCMAALMVPFIYSVHPLACILLIPILYFSKASTCVGATVFSFLFLLWFRNRKIFFIVGSILLGLGSIYVLFFDLPTGQFNKRLQIWWAAINILRIQPWWGYGLGKWNAMNFVTIQQNGIPEKWVWTHSDWIQYAFEQGVLGCIFLYAYFKNLFKNFVLNENGKIIFSSLIAMMVIAAFHFIFHLGRFAGICIYIFSLAEAHKSEFNFSINDSTLDAI